MDYWSTLKQQMQCKCICMNKTTLPKKKEKQWKKNKSELQEKKIINSVYLDLENSFSNGTLTEFHVFSGQFSPILLIL